VEVFVEMLCLPQPIQDLTDMLLNEELNALPEFGQGIRGFSRGGGRGMGKREHTNRGESRANSRTISPQKQKLKFY
jgi:hypothetical protein